MKVISTNKQNNIIDFSSYRSDVLSSYPKSKPTPSYTTGLFLEVCSSISIIIMTITMTVHILLS